MGRPEIAVRQLAPGELRAQVNPRQFAAAVAEVARIIPGKPVVPIMAGIKLGTDDGVLTVSASDFDTTMTVTLDASGANDGMVVVSGRLLANVAKTLPAKPVHLRATDSVLELRCGSIRMTMPLMPSEDYPSPPTVPPTVATIDAGDLATLVARTAVAGDPTGAHAIVAFSGLRLIADGDRVMAIATDRYRVAIGRAAWSPVADIIPSVLVPLRPLMDAVKAMDGDGTVTIGQGLGTFSLATASRSVIIRLIDGKEFPDAIAGKCTDPLDCPARVPAAGLVAAVKRTTALQTDRGAGRIEIAFDAVGYRVRSDDLTSDGVGTGAELTEVVDVDHGGPAVAIGIRPHWLLDAIDSLGTELVDVSITDPRHGVLITSPDIPSDEIRHIVMPIRRVS